MRRAASTFGDFRCGRCGNHVSCLYMLAGVNNRNHCPYCLWSCHLDLFAAGDRLSACKGQMRPIGLTMKRSRNKYRLESGGELMLVHECMECRALSINRIAADDDAESILTLFQESLLNDHPVRQRCLQMGIVMLQADETESINRQLFGQTMNVII